MLPEQTLLTALALLLFTLGVLYSERNGFDRAFNNGRFYSREDEFVIYRQREKAKAAIIDYMAKQQKKLEQDKGGV